MNKPASKLAAVFGVCLATTGCFGSLSADVRLRAVEPEDRDLPAMQGEAKYIFDYNKFEILRFVSALRIPALNVTDLTYDVRREGQDYTATVACPAQRPCRVIELAFKP